MCSGYTDHAWNTFLDSQQVDQIDQKPGRRSQSSVKIDDESDDIEIDDEM